MAERGRGSGLGYTLHAAIICFAVHACLVHAMNSCCNMNICMMQVQLHSSHLWCPAMRSYGCVISLLYLVTCAAYNVLLLLN